jgi:hypothetical protein
MPHSRLQLVDILRHLGYTQEADDALREMPDEFDIKQLREFGDRHGISSGELIDRMGGSP